LALLAFLVLTTSTVGLNNIAASLMYNNIPQVCFKPFATQLLGKSLAGTNAVQQHDISHWHVRLACKQCMTRQPNLPASQAECKRLAQHIPQSHAATPCTTGSSTAVTVMLDAPQRLRQQSQCCLKSACYLAGSNKLMQHRRLLPSWAGF
jgi:hypothetical protein